MDLDEMDQEPTAGTPLKEIHLYRSHFPGAVRQKAYIFDGLGNYFTKEWDLAEGREKEFCWYHVELPKGNQRLSLSAQYLIDVLCPPLKLQDILSLVSNGPFCGYVNGALMFRVNSPGPAPSKFTLRLAARVTENSVITVSLGRIPRLGFSPSGQSLLSDIPSIENPNMVGGDEKAGPSGTVIKEHVLEFLLTMNHSEGADNPVPRTIGNLLVHIVDTHMDHLQDIVTELEMELDTVELEMDNGGFAAKKEMLDDRRFPKMHLNLQRLLQVVAHAEQVFPRVKEKCAAKGWLANEDLISLEEMIGHLRRLKENIGFIDSRVTAIQAGLDSWQAEQINRRLYYLSFLSMIFLPLSVITGGKISFHLFFHFKKLCQYNKHLQMPINCKFRQRKVPYDIAEMELMFLEGMVGGHGADFFPLFSSALIVFGMNVGGVPWTTQRDPSVKDGFWNVMLLCCALLLFLVVCFTFRALYTRISAWTLRKQRALRRSASLNRKSFLGRPNLSNGEHVHGHYVRI